MTWLTILLAVLLIANSLYNLYKSRKAEALTKYNSQVFHPQFDNIWRQAALDWLQSDDDDRRFEEFLTDTIDLILTRGQSDRKETDGQN